jgi:GntR family transcriptional repressor for pyruvate dehydrogenase complex
VDKVASLSPILRQSLPDDVAQRIRQLIQARPYQAGDRLPPISAMARDFGVGAPTLREALKKLETVGVVDIRHGSGVYVGQMADSLVISNPIYDGGVSKKLLVDLIEARIPIETTSVRLAAVNATDADFASMRALLGHAGEHLDDAGVLNQTNLAFHRAIAAASGNEVIRQLLEVLSNVFRHEQRVILDIHGGRAQDHQEHVAILDSLVQRDVSLASRLMHAHLEGVRERLLLWDPSKTPIA